MRSEVHSIDWDWLARMVPGVAIAGVLLGWTLTVLVGVDAAGAARPWGGDYPAFQTAGLIALDGRYDLLYDFEAQDSYQQGMPREGLLPYLYPPFVAAMYAPLALLPYRASYALFTLLSLAALAAAVLVMKPLSATIRADPWRALALVLFFYPMLRGTFGGQNTSISLLILCGAWRLFHEDRQLLAGLVLGLLAYKPQLLVPIAGVVFLTGRYRATLGTAITTALLLVVSGLLAGWDWPITWVNALRPYANADRQFNEFASVALGQITDLFGWEKGWVLLSGLLSLWVAWVAVRKGKVDFPVVLAIAITSSLLIPPHAMFYDLGIVLPALLFLADRGHAREAALLWLGGATQLAAPLLPLSPIIGVLLATMLCLRGALREEVPGEARLGLHE